MADLLKEVIMVAVEGYNTDEDYVSEEDETCAKYCCLEDDINNDRYVEEETYHGIEDDTYPDVKRKTFEDYDRFAQCGMDDDYEYFDEEYGYSKVDEAYADYCFENDFGVYDGEDETEGIGYDSDLYDEEKETYIAHCIQGDTYYDVGKGKFDEFTAVHYIGGIAEPIATHPKREVKETITSKRYLNRHLIRLFKSLVRHLVQDYDLCNKAIRAAIHDMNDTFRKVPYGIYPTQINYDNMHYCVGYLHRFAPCHAAMVQDAILKVLESPPLEITSKFTSKKTLNVVCLGSGPGNDLFGFLSAFHSQCMKLRGIDITVVDKGLGWRAVFNNTVRVLQEESHGNLSRLFREGPNIATSFIRADLEGYVFPSALRAKLYTADVILLMKVLSQIPDVNRICVLKVSFNYYKFQLEYLDRDSVTAFGG